MKNYKIILLLLVFVVTMTSCHHTTTAPEGMLRHNVQTYRYFIDYPKDSCKVKTEVDKNVNIFTIADNDGNYHVDVLAIKSGEDERYKFDFYKTLDSLAFDNLPEPIENAHDWYSDYITRKYELGQEVTLETTSIYGGNIIYCIGAKFNSQGREAAQEIVDSFRTSAGRGVTNFCKRKILGWLGDNAFTTFLNYVLFSLLFTAVFWCGLVGVVKASDDKWFIAVLLLILFLFLFGALALYDHMMGYWYGHESLWQFIGAYLLMFLPDD